MCLICGNRNLEHFREGDLVLCVTPLRDYPTLTKGRLYKVAKDEEEGIFSDRPFVTVIGDDGKRLLCHSSRFIPATFNRVRDMNVKLFEVTTKSRNTGDIGILHLTDKVIVPVSSATAELHDGDWELAAKLAAIDKLYETWPSREHVTPVSAVKVEGAYWKVTHTSSTPGREGEICSITYLELIDDPAFGLVEVIRFTPEFGWTKATQGRKWARSYLLPMKDWTVENMTGLPVEIENLL